LYIETITVAHLLDMKVCSNLGTNVSLHLVVPEVWGEIGRATGNGLEPSLPGE